MFFAYIDNNKSEPGKSLEGLRTLAKANGILRPGMKAPELVAWLREVAALGHGHAMAIFKAFKDEGLGRRLPTTQNSCLAKEILGGRRE